VLNKKEVREYPRICFGVFHVENVTCRTRHELKENLIHEIGLNWTNLQIETFHFPALKDAEKSASNLGFKFDHILEDRKFGQTGFMKGDRIMDRNDYGFEKILGFGF